MIGTYAAELVNDNGISVTGLAFFTALLAAVGKVIVDLYKLRHKTDETLDEAQQANHNSKPVGNGFADKVDRKLDYLIERQDQLSNSLHEHIEWHLRKENQK